MANTMEGLQQLQALPLDLKIRMTQRRIRDWVQAFGESGVYVAFSGGKDSTVLLHIVREIYPDIPAVFVDTGLEYPEIREFVKKFDNVEWLKPKKNFRQVIEEYGYPFISKDISNCVEMAKGYLLKVLEREADTEVEEEQYTSGDEQRNIKIKEIQQNIYPIRNVRDAINNSRVQRLFGIMGKDGLRTIETIPVANKDKSKFNCEKYKPLLKSPFNISAKCCDVMKKEPAKSYSKQTGRLPITAQMACESSLRAMQWKKNGCNGFNMKSPISNPMSFWLEQDVLQYIVEHNLPIASVYGGIVEDNGSLKTTGCKRTGCVFCGFGCHLEKEGEGRFKVLKQTHPKLYDYIMKPSGLNYKKIIDWLNENIGTKIEY